MHLSASPAAPAPATGKKASYFRRNKWLYILLAPMLIYIFVFRYLPMFGIVIAFQDFNFAQGITGSRWVGLDNFRLLFSPGAASGKSFLIFGACYAARARAFL